MEPDTPLPRVARGLAAGSVIAVLTLLWLVDYVATANPHGGLDGWIPTLVSGPLAIVLLLAPGRRPELRWRAGTAAAGSLALTAWFALHTPLANATWGLLESAALLILLARTARRVERPSAALALSAALGAAVIVSPARCVWTWDPNIALVLTFAVGGAAGLGCYLRTLDARRARAMTAVRHNERLELARNLHDFVAHHVTGIIVQANAARAIHRTSPDMIEPILDTIAHAGSETLDSMRRLVRVLREEDHHGARPGEILTELARLVSAFSGDGTQARLEIAAAARAARLAPEVETSVHRVVQEALTNVRRHAPGAAVTVRVDIDAQGRLRVEVHNSPPGVRSAAPVGGSSGFGLVGLRERVEAVEGTLDAGPDGDGGWHVTVTLPVLAPVAGSPV
ncbi:two-component sensor histidine kinase [Streptomyces sp. TM32]|uniref:sensor histidine kinase n=1 Tax=Streptomyces sp. TM32 TaxID=1652669 RepID=UPI001010CE00|nr:histidine kinase [Streptomyces sp. TM32]RXS70611.1 two-component sensor histidine kinase [Streptomyces sp. TM32]